MNRPTRTQRIRDAALWCRDSLLGGIGYTLVLTVAAAGWAASFIGLHDFGTTHMGLSHDAAWLVPITFDGAPAGLSIVVMRASTHGRPALVWRLLIVGFTGLSSWINYQHIDDPLGRTVASFMPPSAVILFEGLMSEARAAAQRRTGRVAPRLHPRTATASRLRCHRQPGACQPPEGRQRACHTPASRGCQSGASTCQRVPPAGCQPRPASTDANGSTCRRAARHPCHRQRHQHRPRPR